jgi:small subunit ribosomal protein S15
LPKGSQGKSQSIRPVTKRPPVWCRYQPEEVEAIIVKLGKEGHSTSSIGVILRDQYGIPLAKPIIGESISQVLKTAGLTLSIPEDLERLLKKAARLHVHLEKNKGDLHNKRATQIIEAKIHRLASYYKHKGVLPPDWKFNVKAASLT